MVYFLKGPVASDMPHEASWRYVSLPALGEKSLSRVDLAARLFDDSEGTPVGVYLSPDTADFIGGRGYGSIYGITIPYYLCRSGPVAASNLQTPGTFYYFAQYNPRAPVDGGL